MPYSSSPSPRLQTIGYVAVSAMFVGLIVGAFHVHHLSSRLLEELLAHREADEAFIARSK